MYDNISAFDSSKIVGTQSQFEVSEGKPNALNKFTEKNLFPLL
jgi:hypothetical protein